MHIRFLAVGDRQPSWVNDAVGVYAGRLPREWKFRVDTVATVRRSKNDKSQQAMQLEGNALLSRVSATEQVVLLDESGEQLTSKQLVGKLSGWQGDGHDLCFVIGGPDGVSERCRERATFIWSLSRLTLAHGMVRILLTEQLYRAWSLQAGHPYHRD